MMTGNRITNVWTVALVAMCVAAFSASTVVAAPVTVANPSFEAGTPPASWGPDGWTRAGGTNAGRYDGATSGGQSGTDGSYWLWVNKNVTVYQDTGEVIVEGTTYTLTVDVGGAFWDGQSATFRLYGSTLGYGTALGGAENTVAVGNVSVSWEIDQTVSFTATATEAGQTLGIALLGASPTQGVYDNVRLEADAPAAATPGTLIYGK
ncbi:MAG: hypothetical protein HN919_03425 [Verrucomicrobia bacterium]|nr:hypothetical protein [Verrucomicrobiota bacterium]MBT7700106.1 hypothetical protein [Verrucomicrobiota bacterium]